MVAHVVLHLRVHPLRRLAEGELAERDQVALAEEVVNGLLRLRRDIDLALLEPLEEVVGGQIHQLDLVGALEDGVGHGLSHHHAGDLGHHVVEALHVLDVQRGVDGDAGVEELEDILPPLAMPGALDIGMSELVDQDHRGPPRQRRVQVEFRERRTPVGDQSRG